MNQASGEMDAATTSLAPTTESINAINQQSPPTSSPLASQFAGNQASGEMGAATTESINAINQQSPPTSSPLASQFAGNQASGEMDAATTSLAPTTGPILIIDQPQEIFRMAIMPSPKFELQSYRLQAPSYNLPCRDLLLGKREHYFDICVPLHRASINGDWKAVLRMLEERGKELVRFSITEYNETILHLATVAQNGTKLVEVLMGLMEEKDLELQDAFGQTALFVAAAAGNNKTTKIMINKNRHVLAIRNGEGWLPLIAASMFGRHDTVKYLYYRSKLMIDNAWTPEDLNSLLSRCIESDLFDVALEILQDFPQLGQINGHLLEVLARKPNAFNDIKPHIIERIINSIFAAARVKVRITEKEREATIVLRIILESVMKRAMLRVDRSGSTMGESETIMIDEEKSISQILFLAAKIGNIKFIVELISQYPDLMWKLNDENQSIFHIAISHRHESIFNLIHEIGSMKDAFAMFKDKEGNNMLHLAGINVANRLHDVSGVAFQMQRELLWFKEVETLVPLSLRDQKNTFGQTPHEVFTQNHKDMVSQSGKWMKDTANQCMVVAALITTIVFAVAFTIPGGYNQNNGFPMFIREETFIVFVIADAISLIFSSASILMFLSILTSHFAEQDFLESLPRKLMVGLATLFLSIFTMMVAFSVSFFILYQNKLIWVPILIGVMTVIPDILYAKLQFPLLVDVFRSIYGSRYLFRPKKHMLSNQNTEF